MQRTVDSQFATTPVVQAFRIHIFDPKKTLHWRHSTSDIIEGAKGVCTKDGGESLIYEPPVHTKLSKISKGKVWSWHQPTRVLLFRLTTITCHDSSTAILSQACLEAVRKQNRHGNGLSGLKSKRITWFSSATRRYAQFSTRKSSR